MNKESNNYSLGKLLVDEIGLCLINYIGLFSPREKRILTWISACDSALEERANADIHDVKDINPDDTAVYAQDPHIKRAIGHLSESIGKYNGVFNEYFKSRLKEFETRRERFDNPQA